MRDTLERLGRGFAVSPAGAPDRPLLEAVLAFAAFYLVSFAPSDASAAGQALGKVSYHLATLVELAPRALLVLYLMARSDGLAAFGLARLRPADLFRGAGTALAALALVAGPAFLLSRLGLTNPLLARTAPSAGPALLLPLVLTTSLAVGYGEELFFRAFLLRRLEQAGLPPAWAAAASTLLFAGAHGLQGAPGIIAAALLGALFAWLWLRRRNIHQVALGHALYDAAVMASALFGG